MYGHHYLVLCLARAFMSHSLATPRMRILPSSTTRLWRSPFRLSRSCAWLARAFHRGAWVVRHVLALRR